MKPHIISTQAQAREAMASHTLVRVTAAVEQSTPARSLLSACEACTLVSSLLHWLLLLTSDHCPTAKPCFHPTTTAAYYDNSEFCCMQQVSPTRETRLLKRKLDLMLPFSSEIHSLGTQTIHVFVSNVKCFVLLFTCSD